MASEIEKEFKKFLSDLVEADIINKEELNTLKVFLEKYVFFQEKIKRTKEEVYEEISKKIAYRILENIVEKKSGKLFGKEEFNLLKNIPSIKLKDIKGVKPEEIEEERLFQVPFFGLTNDSYITTGYIKSKPEDMHIPTNLCISLINLGSLLDKEESRNMIVGHIRHLYNLKGKFPIFTQNISDEERNKFYEKLKYLLFKIKWSFREHIEDLQSSYTFYDRSMGLYTPASESINIFSTSSGLVIPEEYRGDVKKAKNPYRRKYFDQGIVAANAHNLPKYYQWDSEGTSKNLWKGYKETVKSEEYKQEAVEILAKFLQVPGLEITEASFKNDPWKEFFTLVSQKTLVFSERSDIRKINHGILIDDDILKTNKKIYEEISGLLGKREDGIINNIKSVYKRGEYRTYKELNEICENPREAKEKARDIVEILLKQGKNLEKKEQRIKSKVDEKGISKDKQTLESVEGGPKEKILLEEDTIEIGFSDGRPYVKVNRKEVKEFRTKYKPFVNLVALATAMNKGNGWLHKNNDLDLGKNYQTLSKIRNLIAPFLLHNGEEKNIIKANETEEKLIRLEAFKPANIKINKSICKFRSKSENRVKEIVRRAKSRMFKWERGYRDYLLSGLECKQLDREHAILRRQMNLIQKGVENMGWKWRRKEWKRLWEESEEILDKCGHKIEYF